MTDQTTVAVTVTLGADGGTSISLSETNRPVDVRRAAAALLERFAVSLERESEPVTCATCGIVPTGVHASPGGDWRFQPCGHGLPLTPV